jgi:hypothetical protein
MHTMLADNDPVSDSSPVAQANAAARSRLTQLRLYETNFPERAYAWFSLACFSFKNRLNCRSCLLAAVDGPGLAQGCQLNP